MGMVGAGSEAEGGWKLGAGEANSEAGKDTKNGGTQEGRRLEMGREAEPELRVSQRGMDVEPNGESGQAEES